MKVARYSFSELIPAKFEHKLRRYKQAVGKNCPYAYDTSKLVTIAGNTSGTLVTGDEAQGTMRRRKINTINKIKYSVL